ncbi:hypothetical protein LshimejAT787_1801450 [Lyophyllum shimeji]|uniref:Uncharacterized protein n=1 Tax=Lyophyllum shimeji TaxID=47721 RepID=A0A9P3Q0A6_LYOSH|nr:hypothetical protein LshimejAT787_1801450 [Lyophyllum shimeji]
MLRFLQLLCILVGVTTAYGRQVPFQISKDGGKTSQELMHRTWDLDHARRPGVNCTSNVLFDTVNSLLQHWPNTRYRNGHNLVPGTVPPNTLLYHGTNVPDAPTVPEWLATDPEHSYLFCRGTAAAGCWQFTFITTRPLKILYFDGSSAAKMRGGPMDSQDILVWGEVRPEWTMNERRRINDLCDWGKQFELDGFVRMEMDFEIMLCDFANGMEIVSKLNLAAPRIDMPSPPPHHDNLTVHILDDDAALMTTVLQAGSWHNHYPGEPRVQLDLSGLVSFYDTSLVRSLIPQRHGQQRHEHRLQGIAPDDVRAVRDAVAGTLTREEKGSGIDWKALLRVITLRYADRLELLRHLLNSTEAEMASRPPLDSAKLVQRELRIMLTPYIINSAVPASIRSHAEARNYSWASPVFKYCATTHTNFITSSQALSSVLTESESLIMEAVSETNREICRVVVRMWAEGVAEGLDHLLPRPSSPAVSSGRLKNLLSRWQGEIDELIEWLDWSIWIKCRPACSFEEMCYLPTWPFYGRHKGRPNHPRELYDSPMGVDERDDTENDWLIPKPRCIRRVAPYSTSQLP